MQEPAVRVTHGTGSYPVHVEPGLVGQLPALVGELLPGRRPIVITDRTVARAVPHGLDVPTLMVPVGEGSKTRTRWAALTDRMLDLGFGRDSAIVAVGGGVVGDLAGFVAATYLRGIPWLQVPTSLLAMVDASVGGKTGVNTSHGKNLVGAFHPPVAVLADPAVLASLHPAHLGAGLVEAVKHGLVADAAYFRWIDQSTEALLGLDPGALTRLIGWSARIKADIVSGDERESGRRAILNAGHTVGHAVEHVTGYRVLHGDAVAIGLVVESLMAHRLGCSEPGLAPTIRRLLDRIGRPTTLDPAWEDDALLAAMAHDKKVRGSAIRFALPAGIGSTTRDGNNWTVPVPSEIIRSVLASSRSTATLF